MALKLDYALRETATNMRRNLFMTLAAVLVVAVTLFQLGAVFLLRHAIARATDLVTAQVEVSVFLKDDVSPDQRSSIHRDLQSFPEVATVTHETKKQAFERFKELFKGEPEIIANVSPNALPESFRVKLKDPREFQIIRDRLEGRAGIQSIRDARDIVRRVFSFIGALRTAALAMALIVGLAAMILIATTIRIAIFSRRNEIGIMKLVGATNWFIRVPFMLEGVLAGVIGVVLAVGLLLGARPALAGLGSEDFRVLGFDITYADILVQAVWLLVVGVAVGASGSLLGLRRFLDV